MKFKNYILAIFILISTSSLAQIDVNLSGCGTETFTVVGTDGTGRNIYNNGSGTFAIQWNNTAWVPATISGGSDFIDGGFPSDNYSNIATIDGGTP